MLGVLIDIGLLESTRLFAGYRMIVFGGLVALLLIVRPRGLLDERAVGRIRQYMRRRRRCWRLTTSQFASTVSRRCAASRFVPPGARVGVIGPNGSGKTTLFNAISGLVAIAGGTIRLDGRAISRRAPHQIAVSGIARTFQSVRLFQRLSVLDNVLPVTGSAAATGRDARQVALAALGAVGLTARRDTLAGDLSFYEQRRLEIARAMRRGRASYSPMSRRQAFRRASPITSSTSSRTHSAQKPRSC